MCFYCVPCFTFCTFWCCKFIPTKSQEREEDKNDGTLTISHRPLLRLPVAPTSAPAPPSLSSTTPPPGHRSVSEYLTDKSAD
ncbi:hypothetical protein HanRHA438_Chr14g0680771 [Helianthus annuus]|uniref:Uncharacterized protein n=1 Tax=Helianthus annuus TaxID=4232 RepID=A0A251SN09_HELAN|nr:hypothetical protein HanXRQr2_Chr14g0668991 [Helianthus annuus]KAJ0466152.1 hypothetical protein HanHA300_Chr14g0545971 [Helianthus annuus]KAJ0471136.1 hypothetical protein HanIR_Chr14g0726411 [Helianthus annuus]KAJ0487713.1 hypothetical protein HanHA89_Chr14g0593421 [Helianthus annuus]KAJ0658176.1 hypothetical protein HanLR1_Chr14g0554841 [Helianthus annuus]